MSMDYAQMVDGCRRHKGAAPRALYDAFAPMVLGICRRYASCHDEAKDLMQDSMVKVYEKIGTVRETERLKSWIYTLTMNTCVQYCRSHAKVVLTDDLESHLVNDNTDLPYSIEDIVEAMGCLTPSQRLAFNLCDVEEGEYNEVAQQMRCSETNVRVLLSRARARLREYLENKTKR